MNAIKLLFKHSHFLNTVRSMLRTPMLFLSLTVVVALGTAAFAGMTFNKLALINMCSNYYNKYNIYDLMMTSSLGFTQDDLDFYSGYEEIVAARPSYSEQKMLSTGRDKIVAEFITQPSGMNIPEAVSGRLPVIAGECAVELAFSERFGYKLNDTIVIEEGGEVFAAGTYKIVGIIQLPQVMEKDNYYNRGISSLGNGQVETFVLLSESCVMENALGTWQYIYATTTVSDNTLEESYREYNSRLAEQIGEAGRARDAEQYKNGDSKFPERLAEAERVYSDKQEQVNRANALAEQSRTELKEAESELKEAQKKLDRYIELGYETINPAMIEERRADVKACEDKRDGAQNSLELSERFVEDSADAIEQAERNIENLKSTMSLLEDGAFRIYTLESNASYDYCVKTDIAALDKVTYSCSVLLLVVAAVVCYAIISRMAAERKRQIGTQKALGMRDSEILTEFLFYSVSATLVGILGGAAGIYYLQRKIFFAIYANIYQAKDFENRFSIPIILIIAAAQLAIAVTASVFACRSMIKREAVDLMSSSTEGINKLPFYEEIDMRRGKSGRIKLDYRLAMRNMMMNKKALISATVCVASSVILLMGIMNASASLNYAPDNQYTNIQYYSGVILTRDDCYESELAEFERYLQIFPVLKYARVSEIMTSVYTGGEYHYASIISCELEDPSVFFALNDAKNGKRLKMPTEGAYISEKMAEQYGYKVGDTLIFTDSFGRNCETRISAIVERNIGNAIFISPAEYLAATGEKVNLRQYYVNISEGYKNYVDVMAENPAFMSFTDSDIYAESFRFRSNQFDVAIAVMLVLTFLLSVFVLSNLALMNITGKEVELTVMKVMGFGTEALKRYISTEMTISTTFGLVAGTILGIPISLFITRALELDGVMFKRGIDIGSCVMAILITAVFTFIGNRLSLMKIRRLKMRNSYR